MDGGAISGSKGRDQGSKRTRRKAGVAVIERNGMWHLNGTIVVKGRRIRVRKSTGIQARADLWEEADKERLRIEEEIRGQITGETSPGPFLAIAAELYLTQYRERPLGKTSVDYIKASIRKFGMRRPGDIAELEWSKWIDKRCEGGRSTSRERLINTILAFLNWCASKPRRWGTPPTIDRDKAARNPRRRARRQVNDMSLWLIEFLISHAAPHLAAQIWTEWSTGARVSSILHGCSLSDLILAPGREQITFHDTKNGETVTAHLHPRAAAALRAYLPVRGRLHDREGPLFLTHRGLPYSNKSAGVQNKTAFIAMKRRARVALRRDGISKARQLLQIGKVADAETHVEEMRANHRLLGRITQHWFRHLLATKMRGDIRAAMDQGGWIDERSVMAYTIDVPEHRRRLVNMLDEDFASPAPAKNRASGGD